MHSIDTVLGYQSSPLWVWKSHQRASMDTGDGKAIHLHVLTHTNLLGKVLHCYRRYSIPACGVPLDTFVSLLSRTVEKPNPESVPGAPICTQCVGFLKQASLETGDGPFELHPDREPLPDPLGRSALCGV